MVANKVHIATILPSRIRAATVHIGIPSIVRILYLSYDGLNGNLVFLALPCFLRRFDLWLFLFVLCPRRLRFFQEVVIQWVFTDTLHKGIKVHFKRNQRTVKEFYRISR